MLIEELLSVYDDRIFKKRRLFSQLKKGEKVIMLLMLLCGLVFIVLMIKFQYNIKAFITSEVGTIVSICFLMWLDNKLYRKDMIEKIRKFKINNLEELKKILKRHDCNYYSLRQIDIIIEWCDMKAQRESGILTSIRPFSAFATVVFIPVSIMVLDKCLGNEINSHFISVIAAYSLSCLFVFLIWLCYGPIIKDILNRRERVAERLADDLRNLKLNEPNIPEELKQNRNH
jgi:uncharacterized lipoprotein YehR (DUF1307 family)